MGLFSSAFVGKDGYYIKGGGYLIAFDMIRNESHSLDSAVAEHPVEGGISAVSTHIHNKLRSGEFEGLVTNYSLRSSLAANALSVAVGGGTQPTDPNRAKSTFDILTQLWEARTPVSIIMILQVYDNVVINKITADRNNKTGDAQNFRISFKEVRTVSLKKTTIKVGVSADGTVPADKQAASPIDAGKQAGS